MLAYMKHYSEKEVEQTNVRIKPSKRRSHVQEIQRHGSEYIKDKDSGMESIVQLAIAYALGFFYA